MHPRVRHAATLRTLGNITLLAGFLTWLINMTSDANDVEMYVLAILLVVTGVGLRVEAAVTAPSD